MGRGGACAWGVCPACVQGHVRRASVAGFFAVTEDRANVCWAGTAERNRGLSGKGRRCLRQCEAVTVTAGRTRRKFAHLKRTAV